MISFQTLLDSEGIVVLNQELTDSVSKALSIDCVISYSIRLRGIFQGKQLFCLQFCLPSKWGSFLKGKNLLLEEQILSFKI